MSDHQGDSNDQNFDDSELQEIMNEIEDLEREVSSGDSEDSPEEQSVDSPQVEHEESSPESEPEKSVEDKDLQSEIDREMEEAQQMAHKEPEPAEGPQMVEEPEASEGDHSESPEEMRSQMEVVSEEEPHTDEEPAIEFDEEELRALEEDDETPSDSDVNVSSFKKPRGAEPVKPQHDESSPVHFHAHGDMGVNLSFQVGEEHAYLSIEHGPSGKQGLRVQMGGVDLFLDAEEGCCVELEGGARFTVPVKGQQKAS